MRHILFAALAACSTAALAQPPNPPPGPPLHGRGSAFLSPMGEPFRSSEPGADNAGAWFSGADSDHDGALTVAEMQADALRFFAALDADHDGELGPEEIARYENDVAPEVQLCLQMRGGGFGGRRGGWGGGGRRRGGERRFEGQVEYDEGLEGAGRFSYLNIPEPVISADADLNRGVSRAEFARAAGQRFLLLDANHDGRVTRAELPPLPQRHAGRKHKDERSRPLIERTPLPD
ncbi:MAG: hypothetical protein QOK17_1707 [Sphingomonadales bacterium]|jgi:Ca2+-binding EF-hand superfamily protein|nr:hypothetical protein [Sphingomonadales bacterium]